MLLFLLALLFASPLPKDAEVVPPQIHAIEEGRSLEAYAIGAAAATVAAGTAVYASMYHPAGFKNLFSKFPTSVQNKAGSVIDATGKFGKARVANVQGYWQAGRKKLSNFWKKIYGKSRKPKKQVASGSFDGVKELFD